MTNNVFDTVRGSISIKVDKTRYRSKCIDIGHKSKNFGIYSIWQNYIMCHSIAAAASSGECSAVSCGQVKSNEVLYSDD